MQIERDRIASTAATHLQQQTEDLLKQFGMVDL
jgi:hypothetical protein